MYLGESLAWGLSKPEMASQRNLEEMSFYSSFTGAMVFIKSVTFLLVNRPFIIGTTYVA